jgi:hypothetical protein
MQIDLKKELYRSKYLLKVVKKPMNQMYQVLQYIVMSVDQAQMSCKSGFTIWL